MIGKKRLSSVQFFKSTQQWDEGGSAEREPAGGSSPPGLGTADREAAYQRFLRPLLFVMTELAERVNAKDLFDRVAATGQVPADFAMFNVALQEFLARGLAAILDKDPRYGEPLFGITPEGRSLLRQLTPA